jgi:hypothetical protein
MCEFNSISKSIGCLFIFSQSIDKHILIVCDNHGEFSAKASSFKQNRCIKCKRENIPHKNKFSKEDCALLEAECKEMIESLSSNGVVVDNYYIETIACAYKKVFRENDSRYIGYYLDRQAEDIIKTSANWSGVDWDLLWQAREEMLRNDLLNKSVDSDKYKWTYEKKISKIGSERPRNIKLDLSKFLV